MGTDLKADEKARFLIGVVTVLKVLGGLAILMIAAALGGLFLAAGIYGLNASSTDFVAHDATVRSARASVTRGAVNTSSRNSWSVTISLGYTYQVGNTTHPGQGVMDLGRVSSPGEAEQRAAMAKARYTPGAPVTVFVDPDAPARSVLERQGKVWAIPSLAIGAAFLLTLTGIVIGSLRSWWRQRTGLASESATQPHQNDRFLTLIAIALLLTLGSSAAIIGMKRDPMFWVVLPGILIVVITAVLRSRLRR